LSTDAAPHYVDLHVGGRLRLRRKTLGLSQTAVAEAVGLTFQQLQKYERGSNRISASRLHELATVLKMPVSWFFEGLPAPETAKAVADPRVDERSRLANAFLLSTEGLELARLFPTVPKSARGRLLSLIRMMVESDED
jgi:transcriptional regulator with XRE-family HTH domain